MPDQLHMPPGDRGLVLSKQGGEQEEVERCGGQIQQGLWCTGRTLVSILSAEMRVMWRSVT